MHVLMLAHEKSQGLNQETLASFTSAKGGAGAEGGMDYFP